MDTIESAVEDIKNGKIIIVVDDENMSFLSSFWTWSAAGNVFFTIKVLSLITVATMKKNNNIKTISGRDAVDIAGKSPLFFFLNFDIFSLI